MVHHDHQPERRSNKASTINDVPLHAQGLGTRPGPETAPNNEPRRDDHPPQSEAHPEEAIHRPLPIERWIGQNRGKIDNALPDDVKYQIIKTLPNVLNKTGRGNRTGSIGRCVAEIGQRGRDRAEIGTDL